MAFTKNNVKGMFDAAIKKGRGARKAAMAAWTWAKANGVNGRWLKNAERQINDVFGIPPIAYGNIVDKLGFGDLDEGERRLEKVGVFEAMRAARALDNKGFSKLASKLDRITPDMFSNEVDKALKKTSEGASRMNRKSNAVAKQGTTEAECKRLRVENATLKKELADAQKENRRLWRLLDKLGGAPAKRKKAS